MFRRSNILVAVVGLVSLFSIPASVSAQFFIRPPARVFGPPVIRNPVTGGIAGAYNLGPVIRPVGFGNVLARPYVGNAFVAQNLYTNAYLNNAVGNVAAANTRVIGSLYANTLFTNALTGTPNTAALNTLGNAYVANALTTRQLYTNAYLNNAVGNAFAYNSIANRGFYNPYGVYNPYATTYNPYGFYNSYPSFYRYGNVYNPYNGYSAAYQAYTNPYGAFYNVNYARGNNFTPALSGFNPYATYNPYAFNNATFNYVNPYAATMAGFNPYVFYTPSFYAAPNVYVNPYAVYGGAGALTPAYGNIYTAY